MLPSGWADPVTGQWGRPPANGDARVARSQSRVHAVHDQMCVDSEGGGGAGRELVQLRALRTADRDRSGTGTAAACVDTA